MRSRSWTTATRAKPAAAGAPPPLDRVVFRSATVAIGAFRCPTEHPAFADSGPIQNFIFVFPRRSVRLRHEGERAFVADPGVVTLYNRHQRYARGALSPRGDECEWFGVAHDVLLDAVAGLDPAIRDRPLRPFRHAYAPADARVYLAQRALYDRVQGGETVDGLRVEETVLALLSAVLHSAYSFWGPSPSTAAATPRQQELAESVKGLLSERLGDALGVHEIARAAGVSVFHLCRAFRSATGSTLHAYRNRLRLQQALERVAAGEDLTSVGLDLGYSSHSHFSAAFRSLFGVTPRAARQRLGSRARPSAVSPRSTR